MPLSPSWELTREAAMELKLTKSQYETLLRLVYLGNAVANDYRTDDIDAETDALESLIFGKAHEAGLGKYAEFDEGEGRTFPTQAAEEAWNPDLDDYRNDVFWDELEYRLADRDLSERYGEGYDRTMEMAEIERLENEIVEKYYQEFAKNGVKNLMIVRPS
jgi:hypothetical protein